MKPPVSTPVRSHLRSLERDGPARQGLRRAQRSAETVGWNPARATKPVWRNRQTHHAQNVTRFSALQVRNLPPALRS